MRFGIVPGLARRSRACLTRPERCGDCESRTRSGSPNADNAGSIAHAFLGTGWEDGMMRTGFTTKFTQRECRSLTQGQAGATGVVVDIATRFQLRSFGALRAPQDDKLFLFGACNAAAVCAAVICFATYLESDSRWTGSSPNGTCVALKIRLRG